MGDYESTTFYQEKKKIYHDKKIRKQEFNLCDLVSLFNSRLHLFLIDLKSKLLGPLCMVCVFPYCATELVKHKGKFKVNGQRVKSYLGTTDEVKVVDI